MRILILDDSYIVSKMIGQLLEEESINYDIATTYQEAIKYLHIDYDWLICDFFLTGSETGLDFANEYKKIHTNSKVLIYSGKYGEIESDIIDKMIYKSSDASELFNFVRENIFKTSKTSYNPTDQYIILELKKDVTYLINKDCTNTNSIQDHDKKIALFEMRQKDAEGHMQNLTGKFNDLEKKVDDGFIKITDSIGEFKTQSSKDKLATIIWIAGLFFTMLVGFIGVLYELFKSLVK